MENSVIIRCPCCGQTLEVFPGNWLMDSVVRLLPRNTTNDIMNANSQNCVLNSQTTMSLYDMMLNAQQSN